MRASARIAAVAALSLLCTSCTFETMRGGLTRRRGDFVLPTAADFAITAVATYLAIKLERDENMRAGTIDRCDNPDVASEQRSTCWSGFAIVTAALFGVSGIVGVVLSATESPSTDASPPSPPSAEQRRMAQAALQEQATRQQAKYDELEKTAVAAAASGDCASVVRLDPELRRLAAGRYTATLRANPTLAGCVGASPQSADAAATPPESGADLPPTLDKNMIVDGIATIRDRVKTCGKTTRAAGVVTLSIKVAGDGAVIYALVSSAPDVALGECVASAVRAATFARTRDGATFRIPFSI